MLYFLCRDLRLKKINKPIHITMSTTPPITPPTIALMFGDAELGPESCTVEVGIDVPGKVSPLFNGDNPFGFVGSTVITDSFSELSKLEITSQDEPARFPSIELEFDPELKSDVDSCPGTSNMFPMAEFVPFNPFTRDSVGVRDPSEEIL
jgi:hypothetical protein